MFLSVVQSLPLHWVYLVQSLFKMFEEFITCRSLMCAHSHTAQRNTVSSVQAYFTMEYACISSHGTALKSRLQDETVGSTTYIIPIDPNNSVNLCQHSWIVVVIQWLQAETHHGPVSQAFSLKSWTSFNEAQGDRYSAAPRRALFSPLITPSVRSCQSHINNSRILIRKTSPKYLTITDRCVNIQSQNSYFLPSLHQQSLYLSWPTLDTCWTEVQHKERYDIIRHPVCLNRVMNRVVAAAAAAVGWM